MSTPYEEHTELRSGLPTGAGGHIGGDNEETWSLWEQEQAHAKRGSPIAAPIPQQEPVPEPEPEPATPPKTTTRKKT